MHKFINLVDGFSGWNEWYENNSIDISKLEASKEFHPNQPVILKNEGAEDYGIVKGNHVVRVFQNYNPSGISPKNTEQLFALKLLQDKNLPLKLIVGASGSGKTVLSCAHALQRLHSNKDNIAKIVVAKPMTPVGRPIGFLKGDMKEKVMPWLGPFMDNFLNCGYTAMDVEKMIEHEMLEITPITFIQGRSISNAIIMIDEVQNLDLNVVKQLITRAAEGSEVILLGDQTQVFDRFVEEKTLDILFEKGLRSELVGGMVLETSVRSKLAQWAVENL